MIYLLRFLSMIRKTIYPNIEVTKIDKEIIDRIDLHEKSAPITEVIILLARALKARITAEGVETKEQADFLKSITCEEIQGFYYSRPLSPEVLEEFLKKESALSD